MEYADAGWKFKRRGDGLPDGVLDLTGSTDTIDRHGDRVKQCFDLKGFRKDPVFLWGHLYQDLPIGRAVKVWKEKLTGKALKLAKAAGTSTARTNFRIQFVPEEIYPFARQVYEMYRTNFLHATSIGFIPTDRAKLTEEQREEMGLGRWGEYYLKSELLELSAVTVPANSEAVALAMRKGFFNDEDDARSAFDCTDASVLRYGTNIDEVQEYLRGLPPVDFRGLGFDSDEHSDEMELEVRDGSIFIPIDFDVRGITGGEALAKTVHILAETLSETIEERDALIASQEEEDDEEEEVEVELDDLDFDELDEVADKGFLQALDDGEDAEA